MQPSVTPSPARLAALWFGIQATWSAILGVTLQTRAEALDPAGGVATYGAVAVAGALVATVVQLAAGFVSDRRASRTGSRRVFYIMGIAVAVPALVVVPIAWSPLVLTGSFVVLQIGMNIANGPYQAAVPDHVPAAREGAASAWMGALSSAGAITGLIVAIATRGAATGIALAVILVLAAIVTERHVARLGALRLHAEPLRVNRNVVTLLLSRGAVHIGFYTLFGFLFFFIRESLGIADPRTTTGIIFLAFTFAAIGGAALAARPTDRIDKRRVVTVAGIGIALGVASFALAPALPVAIVAGIVAGASWGAFTTADWAIAFDILPRGAMASAMGVWNLAVTIPQIVAPAITTPLVAAVDARHYGLGPRIALALVVVEFGIATALLWRLPRLGPRHESV